MWGPHRPQEDADEGIKAVRHRSQYMLPQDGPVQCTCAMYLCNVLALEIICHLPLPSQLLVLRRSNPDGVRRAARLLAEVVRRASLLCRGAAQSALYESMQRLKTNGLVEDTDGRLLLLDTQADVRCDLCMLYCCVATAAPSGAGQDTRAGSMPLLRGLCLGLRSGVEWQATVAMQALGNAHQVTLPGLVPELAETLREAALGGGKLRGKARREDVRLYVAHIWRQVRASREGGGG